MFEHKGYTVIQVNKENAYVMKDGSRVLHANCTGTLSEDDMRELVESYLALKEKNAAVSKE